VLVSTLWQWWRLNDTLWSASPGSSLLLGKKKQWLVSSLSWMMSTVSFADRNQSSKAHDLQVPFAHQPSSQNVIAQHVATNTLKMENHQQTTADRTIAKRPFANRAATNQTAANRTNANRITANWHDCQLAQLATATTNNRTCVLSVQKIAIQLGFTEQVG